MPNRIKVRCPICGKWLIHDAGIRMGEVRNRYMGHLRSHRSATARERSTAADVCFALYRWGGELPT